MLATTVIQVRNYTNLSIFYKFKFITGNIGLDGDQGINGEPGFHGEKGEVGYPGLEGLPGPIGELALD